MPEELDPRWEYWVPSEEMEELLGDYVESPEERYQSLFDHRAYNTQSLGIRYGYGNPNRFNGRLAPERYQVERDSIRDRKCPNCSYWFTPDRRNSIHCSNRCYKRKGRRRERPLERNCKQCLTPFEPLYLEHIYCSRVCAGLVGSNLIRVERPIINCGACGGIFTQRRLKQQYCNISCGLSKNGGRNKKVAPINCAGCGEIFTPKATHIKSCSRACGYRVISRKQKGIPKIRKSKLLTS